VYRNSAASMKYLSSMCKNFKSLCFNFNYRTCISDQVQVLSSTDCDDLPPEFCSQLWTKAKDRIRKAINRKCGSICSNLKKQFSCKYN